MNQRAETGPSRATGRAGKRDDPDADVSAIATSIPCCAAAAAAAVAVCTRTVAVGRGDGGRPVVAPPFVLLHPLLDREHVAVLHDQIVAVQAER